MGGENGLNGEMLLKRRLQSDPAFASRFQEFLSLENSTPGGVVGPLNPNLAEPAPPFNPNGQSAAFSPDVRRPAVTPQPTPQTITPLNLSQVDRTDRTGVNNNIRSATRLASSLSQIPNQVPGQGIGSTFPALTQTGLPNRKKLITTSPVSPTGSNLVEGLPPGVNPFITTRSV